MVTEPTLSGEHDLERVLQLTQHFGIPAMICVNKWDLNPSMTERIERMAEARGATVAGRVRYDTTVTAAQVRAQAVVECESAAADDVRALWESVKLKHNKRTKENHLMKIAIPVEAGRVSMHFGHCTEFAIYDVDDASRAIRGTETRTPPPHEPGVLPQWLHELGANVIITGGMGRGPSSSSARTESRSCSAARRTHRRTSRRPT